MRKVVSLFALCGTAGYLCAYAVPAGAAPAGTVLATAPPADDTVGGGKLASHGYIWDKSVPEPPHIEASSYVIADLETGRVLAAKDPHGHYRPASTLKTLTAITLIPRLDPKQKVRPSLAAVNASGSAVGLDTKMSYTVDQLFHGLLMQSGNDAAIALAEAGGGMKTTLAAMNAEAKRIQANDTVARTPNGLDDDPPLTLAQQHSSAYDLALIMKQGLTLPDFVKYVKATTYHWPALPTKEERKKGKKTGGWEIGTHDHLLVGNPYRGMIGGKNGWTSHALGSFVGAARRGGHTIIISLMHAQSDFWPDARALLDWGFAERDKAGPVGTLVDPIPPPAKPTPKAVAHKPAADRRTTSSGALDWWKVGLPAGAVVAIIAGLTLGLRRRRRPAAAGPDPYTPPADDAPPYDGGGGVRAEGPDARPPRTRRTPPGDVKVAGAPLNPGDRPRPESWSTVPNPTQDGPAGGPESASGEDTVADAFSGDATAEGRAEETVRDDAAEDTVVDRRTGRSPRGPFEPHDGNGADGGETTRRDKPHGDEPARP
jgi:D-alanyl-D-alanine carboxypeptidase (penicillin-binding protein 5/6)